MSVKMACVLGRGTVINTLAGERKVFKCLSTLSILFLYVVLCMPTIFFFNFQNNFDYFTQSPESLVNSTRLHISPEILAISQFASLPSCLSLSVCPKALLALHFPSSLHITASLAFSNQAG